MTTKFPLCAILMELAATVQGAESELSLDWVPRDQNTEADELSNGDFKRFDPRLRVDLDLEKLPFVLLPEMLSKGERLYQYIELSKRKRAEEGTALERRPKRKPETRLRTTHPW